MNRTPPSACWEEASIDAKLLSGRQWATWARSEHIFPRAVRLITIEGVMWGLVEMLDRFDIKTFPKSGVGLLVFGLIGLNLFFCGELWILNKNRPRPPSGGPGKSPALVFADSLLVYAQSLGADGHHKDQAILELRSWSSRLLHLMGAFKERIELGQIALEAAAALQDKVTQASILIDDVGWALYKDGDSATAKANMEEGLQIIDEELRPLPQQPTLLSLKVKALRHIANIDAEHQEIGPARRAFSQPRDVAKNLPTPDRELHLAQLDHSEAVVICGYLKRKAGASAQIDPTGSFAALLQEGIALAEQAELAFNALADAEREAKALKVKVDLLVHDTRKQRYREAATRLSRLEKEVSRDLR